MTIHARQCFIALTIAFAGLALSPCARGQVARREGIDLVLLVDVSGSMFQLPEQPDGTGNDRKRIRWDAVLLSLNLLTSEDRVLVIPFNTTVPAKFGRSLVPGALSEGFFDPRDPVGRRDQTKIRTFRHNEAQGPSASDEYNGDVGWTAILKALEEARARLKIQRDPARNRFVVLLTDGLESKQSEKPRELQYLSNTPEPGDDLHGLEKDDGVKRWLADFPPVKVYTMGLGNKVDRNLLNLVALKTEGHFYAVANNGQLIDTFRDLIWQLKGCWTKTLTKDSPRPLTAPGPEEDLMSRISEVGILYYKNSPENHPRNYVALKGEEDLSFTRKDRQDAAIMDAGTGFRAAEESYTYVYHNLNGGDPKAFEKLVTEWKPLPSDRRVHFSKRTVKPLFPTVEFTKGSVPRYQPLRIVVNMNATLGFQASQFELDVMLKRGGGQKGDAKPLFAKPVPMSLAGNAFSCNLDLASLESSGGDFDDYTLVVTAKGKPSETNYPLRDYTLELPPVDFQVDNSLSLKEVPLVTFSNDQPRQRPIKLEPEGKASRSTKGMRPLKFRVKLVEKPGDSQKRPVIKNYSREVTLAENQAGELEGDLKVELPDDLPIGVHTGREFEISSADPAYPKMSKLLTVQFQVSISTIKVQLNRNDIINLEYEKGAEVTSEDLQVVVPNRKDSNSRLDVTVTIPDKGFTKDELWLRPRNQAATNQARSQVLVLSRPEESFLICYKPGPKHLAQFTAFELGVSVNGPGYEYNPKDGTVHLNFKTPKLQTEAREPLRVQRGRPFIAELKVGLKGGVAASREVTFQCKKPGALKPESPTFQFKGEPVPNSRIDLEPLETVTLTASDPADPRSLRIKITAPEGIKCGEYTLVDGELSAERTESKRVDLTVKVNDLEVTDGKGGAVSKDLFFYQLKGKPLVREFNVFAAEGNLTPEQVYVVEDGGFLNVNDKTENSDLHVKTLAKVPTEPDKEGRVGVKISLAFPDLDPSFEQYSGDLVFHCKGQNLTKTFRCAVQRVELLRAR